MSLTSLYVTKLQYICIVHICAKKHATPHLAHVGFISYIPKARFNNQQD